MICFRDSSVEVGGDIELKLCCYICNVVLTPTGQAVQEQRGPGLLTNLEVSLADMYMGRTVEVRPYTLPEL